MSELVEIGNGTSLDAAKARAMSAAISRALRRAARQSRQPAPLIVGGGSSYARRSDRNFRIAVVISFVLFVALPFLGASIYWGLLASKQYASEAKFTLRSGESSPLDPLGGIASLATAHQMQDTNVLANYIESPTIIEVLDKEIGLKALYSDPSIDYISRLAPDASIEKFEKYWRKRIDIKVDPNSAIVTVNIRAFKPEDSERITSRVVALAEKLANELAERPRQDALKSSETELRRAEAALRQRTIDLRDARNTEGVVDANASAEVLGKVLTVLRLQLAESEAALEALGPVVQNSPQSRVSRAKIEALKVQINAFSSQIAGAKQGESMASRLSALSIFQTELDIARQRYAEASASYQTARVDMETQRSYVVAFLKPILAQESTYPRRWLEWLLIVMPSLILWSIGAAIAFQVRDHMAK